MTTSPTDSRLTRRARARRALTDEAAFDRALTRLLYMQIRHAGKGIPGRIAQVTLKCFGIDWQTRSLGHGLILPHASTGSVVHKRVQIGNRVTLFHGVTVGQADIRPDHTRDAGGVTIGDDVTIGAQATILFRSGQTLNIGNGAVVGANAVILQSIGPHEVWAGNPARRIGTRNKTPTQHQQHLT